MPVLQVSEYQIERLVHLLDALNVSDPEAAHSAADDLILENMPPEVRLAYARVVARCSWWGAA